MVSAVSVENIANQPPTPPIDLDHDLDQAIHLLDVDFAIDQDQVPQACSRAGTPVQPSPPSSQDPGSRHRSGRRVEFSPCVTAHDPPSAHQPAGTASPITRRFPSSKQPRPIRSILKATIDLQTPTPDTVSPAADYFSISDPKSFPAMLDSVLKSLDAPSTAMRLDGYSTLNGALKAYDDLPDVDILRAKMPLLVKIMARDIVESSRKSDPMTSNLTTQALKLTTAILMLPALEDAIDEQFQTLLIDRALEVLEQDPVPKSIANHHMFLLATQRFSSRVVTETKVERIVASLVTIHERVSGNSVIASRLVILQRLMEQAPQIMLGNMRDWMPHIFHGVLSSIKDVRVRAIDTGTQAAMRYGKVYICTKVIIDLFHTATPEGNQYGAYFTARLFEMAKSTEAGGDPDLEEAVPQIWSMVVLFFKSKKVRLSQWRLFCVEWLQLIEDCLNSKNLIVRFRAMCAWNRLVYVINPDHDLREKMNNWEYTLRLPFAKILPAFRGRDKKSKEIRHIALSGYCNLLHYALRPDQSWDNVDHFWDLYVYQILDKLLVLGGRDANMACRVLRALFNGKATVWDEELANKAPILPESLSRLSPTWVRSRTHVVLDLIGPFLELSLAQPGDGRGTEATPWREFMTAIANAGSQEVLRSQELKECLAQLMNLFSRLWTRALQTGEYANDVWIARFASLVQCSIEVIGPQPFGEDILSRTETKTFEAAPTPSNRTSKHHQRLQSPAVFLFELFTQPHPSVDPSPEYLEAAKAILHQICQGRSSRKERLEIIRKCVQASSTSGSVPLWKIAVEATSAVLLDPNLNEKIQEPARLGHQARHAISIIASGLNHEADVSGGLPAVFELVDVLAKILKQEAGDGGITLGFMEPMAEALLHPREKAMPKSVLIPFATKLLQVGTFPRNKQQMDEARKSLWNTHLPSSKQSSFEPFNHIYELINSTLLISYDNIDEAATHLTGFVEAAQSFLSKCPTSLFASPALRRVQPGISQIIKDEKRVLAGNKNARDAYSKVLALWQSILDHLKNLPSNKTLLKALDDLFAAGLNSTHREVINTTVSFWNSTFGRLESLEYPSKVEYAMRRLRPLVELDLPTFPENHSKTEPSPLDDLIESQQDMDTEVVPTPSKNPIKKSQRSSVLGRAISASPLREKPTARRQPASKSMIKSRLRHDDSQVEFAEVTSSSPVPMDSQLMTEHQREVKSRQQFQTAVMYPELSSSPGPDRRTSRSGLPVLDFTKQQDVTDTGYATPTLNDEAGPMDEYVTSSPTPKATEKSRAPDAERSNTPEADVAEIASDVDDFNVPSSPPEMADDTVYEGTTEIENMEPVEQKAGSELVPKTVPVHNNVNKQVAQENPAVENVSNKRATRASLKAHPSVKRLKQGTEAGTSSDIYTDARSEVTQTENDNRPTHETDDGDEEQAFVESGGSSPLHFTDSLSEQPQDKDQSFVDETTVEAPEDAPAEGNISRVLDSFADTSTSNPSAKEETPVKPVIEATTPSSKSSKRKRSEPTEKQPSAKRRKSSASPFNRLFSFFTASQADEDDEDIQDCIVVGSQAGQEADVQSEASEDVPIPESAPASAVPATTKRGRGRPKKPTTSSAGSPASSVMTRASKRRASTLEDDESQASMITDTPAPSKSRRTTRSQDAKTGQATEHVMLPVGRKQRRKLESVAVSPPSYSGSSKANSQESDDEDNHEADSQLKQEAEAAIRSQPVKPKSLIERVRDILIDCKTMMLGSQEEREFQDVLYELGKEVYEARKRSRDAGMD